MILPVFTLVDVPPVCSRLLKITAVLVRFNASFIFFCQSEGWPVILARCAQKFGRLFAFHPNDDFIHLGDANSGNRGREKNGRFSS